MIIDAHHHLWTADYPWLRRPGLEQLAPFVQAALELFGAGRLMYGSDWPVCTLAGSYADTLALLNFLTPSERADVLAGTAISTYRLEVDR